jgi:hypothetical protein
LAATSGREQAREPEDLSDFFIERANAGDVEGLVALYEPDAVLAFPRLPGGGTTVEVARRQPDGTWLWAIDQPSLLSS